MCSVVHWVMPTRISPETHARIAAVWPDLLDAISDGRTVRDVLNEHGLSNAAVRAFRVSSPEADRAWQVARENSADAYMARLLDTVNDATLDHRYARNVIDALKWVICKYNPRLYGDRMDHNVTVKTIDLTRIIQDANARLAMSRASSPRLDISDAEVVPVALLSDLL